MPKPETVWTVKCPTCGSEHSAPTKFKAFLLWQRWMRTVAEQAVQAIKRIDPPRELW